MNENGLDYCQLLLLFEQNGSKKYDDFNRRIVNSSVKSLGCTIPYIRSVAKLCSDRLPEILILPVHDYYEVDMLKGMAISSVQMPFAEKSALLWDFAGTLENWAVCDCNTVKVPESENERYFELFLQMCRDSRPFVCRYGLVNLMANFLDEVHVSRVFEVLKSVQFGHYYVDMAAAWLVATAMVKCRTKTVGFMENEGRTVLNAFTYNKALQKMRDSSRVLPQDKVWSKTLKIKY